MMKILRSVFDKNFIKLTMMIAFPIMVQTGITNFVNMPDNIMVGRIGTDPMTGVSIVNSLLLDSCFCWAVSIPAACFLVHYTQVPILPMYTAVISCELIKVVIGITLVNKGIWIKKHNCLILWVNLLLRQECIPCSGETKLTLLFKTRAF